VSRARAKPFRVFVAGTDTGVGKTETACAILSLLADRGLRPAPFKPYESGMRSLSRPSDALRLRSAGRSDDALEDISIHRFKAPLGPGVAAERLGSEPDFRCTLAAFARFRGRPLVVEGAGGLFVPIDRRRDVIDLIRALGLPVILVARAGLGTLNHTRLSVEALVARGIPILGVILVKTSRARDPSENDNARWIARRCGVRVLGPVAHALDPRKRRTLFRAVLDPLLDLPARSVSARPRAEPGPTRR
jgi:dethiobiotin synthetase